MKGSTHQIAIDGPAGAGKSTIAKSVAKELGFIYIDTGAMYRAMAVYMLRNGVKADDAAAVERHCTGADILLRHENGVQQVFLNGENVTGLLRTQEVGEMASAVSTHAPVREQLVRLQRKMAEDTSVVMDGRDIGTVVLPHAALKIYLTASPAVRARRRLLELQEKGKAADYEAILAEIEERDYRDMHRAHSPLKKADDAVEVDSSEMTVPEVADRVLSLYRERVREAGA